MSIGMTGRRRGRRLRHHPNPQPIGQKVGGFLVGLTSYLEFLIIWSC
jgi:hypothetical protein